MDQNCLLYMFVDAGKKWKETEGKRGKREVRFKFQILITVQFLAPWLASFLSSIRVQTDKIWKLGLEHAILCKWDTCTHQTCLLKTLFNPGIWPASGLVIIVKNKLTSVFPCICRVTEGKFCHSIVEVCCRIIPQALWQCIMHFIINKRTDA